VTISWRKKWKTVAVMISGVKRVFHISEDNRYLIFPESDDSGDVKSYRIVEMRQHSMEFNSYDSVAECKKIIDNLEEQ
jgi:hypothetical protein